MNSCTGYFPGGIGWYRKHIEIADTTRTAYLYFEGVYNRSEVYVNGKLAGKSPNGYISFYYDITPLLKQGENVIAVKADHSREADSRWHTGSGIYRDVWLVTAPEKSFRAVRTFLETERDKREGCPYCCRKLTGSRLDGKPYALRATLLDKSATLAQNIVEAVDKSGNRVPYASDPISCICEDDGSLIVLEGTGNTDMSHPKATVRSPSDSMRPVSKAPS